MTTEKNEPGAVELTQAMTALLALFVAEREERIGGREPRKTEVLLADAGLSYSAIAQLTGRPYETVKTAIRRAREGKTPGARTAKLKPREE